MRGFSSVWVLFRLDRKADRRYNSNRNNCLIPEATIESRKNRNMLRVWKENRLANVQTLYYRVGLIEIQSTCTMGSSPSYLMNRSQIFQPNVFISQISTNNEPSSPISNGKRNLEFNKKIEKTPRGDLAIYLEMAICLEVRSLWTRLKQIGKWTKSWQLSSNGRRTLIRSLTTSYCQ